MTDGSVSSISAGRPRRLLSADTCQASPDEGTPRPAHRVGTVSLGSLPAPELGPGVTWAPPSPTDAQHLGPGPWSYGKAPAWEKSHGSEPTSSHLYYPCSPPHARAPDILRLVSSFWGFHSPHSHPSGLPSQAKQLRPPIS